MESAIVLPMLSAANDMVDIVEESSIFYKARVSVLTSLSAEANNENIKRMAASN
jgi:hypothetical protein